MKVPKVNLSDYTISSLKQIVKASKKAKTAEEQMVMANYYGYLYSKAKTDVNDFAKILLSR